MGACASSSAAVFNKHFEVDETTPLGVGSYATVFAGRNKRTGGPVVVKRIDRTAAAEDCLGEFWQDEASIMTQMTPHANIIELLHLYESPTHVYLVTEMAEGGELFQALISGGAYSEWDARRFTSDIFQGLKQIHSKGIVHRDIKPENLLLTSKDTNEAKIKLSDFGSAMPLNGTSHFDCSKLTWAYCAPEILRELLALQQKEPSYCSTMEQSGGKDKVSNMSATTKSDVWSVGIVLYVLLSGTHPFDPDGRQTKDQIIANILLGKFSLTEPALWEDEVSAEAKSFLKLLLSCDPLQRPTAEEALAHPWFKDAETPRVALQVSISNGLGQYQLLMQKKFRTSVMVAMAAQSLRRSLLRIRNSKTGSGLQSAIQDDGSQEQLRNSKTGNSLHSTIQEDGSGSREQLPPPLPKSGSAVSKLFRRDEQPLEEYEDASAKQSMDLIDEFDGDVTREAQPVL